MNVLDPFNKGIFELNLASAIVPVKFAAGMDVIFAPLMVGALVPKLMVCAALAVSPLLNVMAEENVLAPPTVCVVVKSTYEPPPLIADAGIVPAAMFAPLMVGALVPKLIVCAEVAVIPPNVVNVPDEFMLQTEEVPFQNPMILS